MDVKAVLRAELVLEKDKKAVASREVKGAQLDLIASNRMALALRRANGVRERANIANEVPRSKNAATARKLVLANHRSLASPHLVVKLLLRLDAKVGLDSDPVMPVEKNQDN